MKIEKNYTDLCHSCSKQALIDIIYTKYGAKITLCKQCVEGLIIDIHQLVCNGEDWADEHQEQT